MTSVPYPRATALQAQRPVTAAAVTRLQDRLLSEFHEGLFNRDFVIHYQPKVVPALWEGGAYVIESAEALLRWRHPQLGLLMPGVFMPVCEQIEGLQFVTNYVLEEVLGQIAQWQVEGFTVPVSINLAPSLLYIAGLPDRFAAMAERAGVSPTMLTFEISAAPGFERSATVLDTLASLRLKGFRLALDDFNAGGLPLSILSTLPFTEVKIDRSFLADMDQFDAHEAATRDIIARAHDAGLTVCAEGVERADIAARLIDMGCDFAQGFLFGRPVDAAGFTEALRDNNTDDFIIAVDNDTANDNADVVYKERAIA